MTAKLGWKYRYHPVEWELAFALSCIPHHHRAHSRPRPGQVVEVVELKPAGRHLRHPNVAVEFVAVASGSGGPWLVPVDALSRLVRQPTQKRGK